MPFVANFESPGCKSEVWLESGNSIIYHTQALCCFVLSGPDPAACHVQDMGNMVQNEVHTCPSKRDDHFENKTAAAERACT